MSYQMNEQQYLMATPAGAFYAVQSELKDASRLFLLHLLSQPVTPKIEDKPWLKTLGNDDAGLDVLYRLEKMGYIQALDDSFDIPQGALEDLLPSFLPALSGSEKALLADEQGFYISGAGVSHETAEEVSALSAELLTIYQRRKGLLQNNISLKSSAWAVVDPAGNSEIGFWPLHFVQGKFTLILMGVPHLNRTEFTLMLSCLAARYAKD